MVIQWNEIGKSARGIDIDIGGTGLCFLYIEAYNANDPHDALIRSSDHKPMAEVQFTCSWPMGRPRKITNRTDGATIMVIPTNYLHVSHTGVGFSSFKVASRKFLVA